MRLVSLAGIAGLAVVMTNAAVPPVHADASGELRALAADYWESTLEFNPTYATSLGDHRFDDRLDDNSPAGQEAFERAMTAFRTRAQAIDTTSLSPADRLTHTALLAELNDRLAQSSCRLWEWNVDPLGGPQVWLINIPDYTSFRTPADGEHYVTRCRAMGRYIDQHIANLKSGLEHGKVASADAVRKSLETTDQLVAQPSDQWALVAPVNEKRKGWTAEQQARFKTELTAVVDQVVKPAMGRYGSFLRDEVMPKARPQERAGLAAIPGGTECYERLVRASTSLDLSPEQLHQIGLEQVAKFRADLAVLGQKVLGTSDIHEIQRRLRNDPAMQFKNAAEVEATARGALARAQRATPKWFGIQPKAPCQVKIMGMHEAPNSTIAYYREPAADGSRPGYYMLNTYKPTTRPRYEAEALAFHEAVPGHHLQIAIAQEMKGLPEFRKYGGSTAFIEGWALYTERLADEMGLYSSDLDRIGMLSYDAWRACRLVVDTGMHSMGWSRQQAIDYMTENSVLATNNIENEVDRYLVWPGQAVAYKVGQLEILKLRDEAKRRLGDRFKIRDFHDAVLSGGGVSLPVLRQQVEAWIERTESAAPRP